MSSPITKLRIRVYGDPCLKKQSQSVSEVTDRERAVLDEMARIMYTSGGIGLAAPQVGLNKQMIIADVGKGLLKLVNPRVVKKSGSEAMEEGCLSLPGIQVCVRRATQVEVSGLNENNEKVFIEASDLLARVLQHEIDHLHGRLIVDYANVMKKIRLIKALSEMERRVDREL